MRAALRVNRYGGGSLPGGVFSAQGLTINYDRRKVFVEGQEVRLTQTEYNIVAFLSQHAGRVMTYAAIVRAIWGDTDASSTKKLQVNMANIRKKLGSRPGSNTYILNELGRRLSDDRRRRQAAGTCGGDEMTLALSLFVLFYILMLAVQQYRPWVALGGAGTFLLLGKLGVYDFTLADAARAVDFNVLLMMAGMMGTVFLFIPEQDARPAGRRAHCPCAECPVGRVGAGPAGGVHQRVRGQCGHCPDGGPGGACHRPAAETIAGAGAHRHCGVVQFTGRGNAGGGHHEHPAGRLCGDEFLRFLLDGGSARHLLERGAGGAGLAGVLFWLFRDQRQPVHVAVETEVEDDVPTALLLLTVGLLIAASFLPEPSGGVLHLLYTLRSGLVCMGLCLFGAARACWRSRSLRPLGETARALDYDTLLLLFSLFILLEGVGKAGVIDAAAQLFHRSRRRAAFRLYVLLVVVSVGLSAFIDNIPYVAAMLPVVQGVAALMNGGAGIEPELFYFGLLTGATLGGNLTPIGASANIAAIGILRKNGETVRTRDFLRIGVPFTLAAS